MNKFLIFSLSLGFVLSIPSCNNKLTFELSDLGDSVQLHTDKIDDFLKNPTDSYFIEGWGGKEELSIPNPVKLSWKCNGYTPTTFTIKVSENNDMSDALEYTSTTTEFDLYNCKINTKYYWTVEADNYKSNIATFSSNNLKIRMLHIDGITNCRDLGGYVTEDKKEINQGLIYRTARYNESSRTTIKKEITDAGEHTFKNELKIKTEIDLRRDVYEAGGLINKGVMDGVNYYPFRMEWEKIDNLLTNERNKPFIRDLFNFVLCNKENYPLSIHCNIGTDRTGCIAYTLLALCGVSKEDLVADYLLSNFGLIGEPRRFSGIADTYPKSIDAYTGTKLKEKTENFLKEQLGVKQESIDSIRNILIKN